MELRRKLFSAISWRAEARAATLPAQRGQQVRERFGQLMEWSRAHDSLPDIAQRAAILCLHGVVDHEPDPDVERDAVPLPKFRRLLRVIERSFNVISLAELVHCIREGQSPPPRSVVITFDDGYVTNFTVAADALADLDMPWSTFLPAQLVETGARQWIDDLYLLIYRGSHRQIGFHWDDGVHRFDLGNRDQCDEAVFQIREACRYIPEAIRAQRMRALYDLYSLDELQSLRAQFPSFAPMSWEQARQLKTAGVDVGSHSLTHIALGPQPVELVRHELTTARQILQERIGDHSPHFSYPYGRQASFSDETEKILREMGYHCGLTLEQDAIHCPGQNLMCLPRLIVSPLIGRVLFGLWQRFSR